MAERKLSDIFSQHISAYNDEDAERKQQMHACGKRQLRRLAVALGLATVERDIRSNMGGIAVSGEVTLHSDTFYCQLSQSCMGAGNEIMFRACNGRDDYSGKQNHFAPASALDDPREFAQYLCACGRFGFLQP